MVKKGKGKNGDDSQGDFFADEYKSVPIGSSRSSPKLPELKSNGSVPRHSVPADPRQRVANHFNNCHFYGIFNFGSGKIPLKCCLFAVPISIGVLWFWLQPFGTGQSDRNLLGSDGWEPKIERAP